MRKVRLAVGILATLLLAACGGVPAAAPAPSQPPSQLAAQSQPAPAPAKPLDHVVLRLDYTIVGYHAPFYVAVAKGFYKDAGIDADVQEGKGSVTTIQTVANGSDTFGYVSGGALIQSIGKGIPVISIATPLGVSPTALLVRADSKINSPKDLAGKQLGGSAGGAAESMLPAFAKANGLDPNAIHLVTIAGSAKAQALATGKVDAITATVEQIAQVQVTGVKVRPFLYADYGLNLPGTSLITANTYLTQHPDVVRRFLKASLQGFAYAEQHPDEAIEILHGRFPTEPVPALLDELQRSFPLEHSKATQGKPLGWMSPDDWQNAVKLEQESGMISKSVAVDQLITNEYLPQS